MSFRSEYGPPYMVYSPPPTRSRIAVQAAVHEAAEAAAAHGLRAVADRLREYVAFGDMDPRVAREFVISAFNGIENAALLPFSVCDVLGIRVPLQQAPRPTVSPLIAKALENDTPEAARERAERLGVELAAPRVARCRDCRDVCEFASSKAFAAAGVVDGMFLCGRCDEKRRAAAQAPVKVKPPQRAAGNTRETEMSEKKPDSGWKAAALATAKSEGEQALMLTAGKQAAKRLAVRALRMLGRSKRVPKPALTFARELLATQHGLGAFALAVGTAAPFVPRATATPFRAKLVSAMRVWGGHALTDSVADPVLDEFLGALDELEMEIGA